MRQRDILRFWLPLLASWLLMTGEGPLISAAVNRLPNEVVMLAALGLVVSLEVIIESPIIGLLSTSTALVRDRASYLLVRKFTVHWLVALAAVNLFVAFTPLFDVVVVGWLEAPPEVAMWVRPGLQIMILWSTAIGWRKFMQGILIRFGRTGQVAWGTLVRLLSSGGTILGLSLWSGWPGVIIGAVSLMAGVTAEAIFATIAVRPLLKERLGPEAAAAPGKPLTYRELFWFHLPLAGTSTLGLLAQPLVAASLARLDNPTETLAAWPVLFQLMLVSRAGALALPEVIIALLEEPERFRVLRRFSLNLAVALTLFLLVFTLSPAADFYIFSVQDVTRSVGELARSGLVYFLPFPALTAMISWYRGIMIYNRVTRDINVGMAINLILTGTILAFGVAGNLPGLVIGAVALNLAAAGELGFLGLRAQNSVVAKLSRFEAVG